MNTFTVEHVDGGFKVRVTSPHGGSGHLMEPVFATLAEAETFCDRQRALEDGRAGLSPEDRPP